MTATAEHRDAVDARHDIREAALHVHAAQQELVAAQHELAEALRRLPS